MIRLFTGTIDDAAPYPIRGNGKTNFMTLFLFLDKLSGRDIYTNYYTSFSKVLPTEDIVKMILSGKLKNVTIGIDEIQIILNSLGSKKDVVLFCDKCFSQTRKSNIDIYATTQRYMNVHVRFRTQCDIVYIPVKKHLDNKVCKLDRCKKDHILYLFQERPKVIRYILKVRPELIGKLYDSDQIIDETINFKDMNKQKEKIEKEITEEREKENRNYDKQFKSLSKKTKQEILKAIREEK